MKKALSLILALALVMSLSITAFASETGVSVGDYGTEVTGTYVEGTTSSGTMFSVDIVWSGMSFTYYAEKAPVWNTENHTYSEKQDAYWEGEGTITVKNHSNARISATPAYTKETGYESAEITFDADKLVLMSAEVNNAVVSKIITVTPGGSLPAISNDTNSAKIGTITVTIAQCDDVTLEEAKVLDGLISERKTAWSEAGLTDDNTNSAITACNTAWYTLQETIRNMEAGNGNQAQLNMNYNSTLAAYEKVESYMPAN